MPPQVLFIIAYNGYQQIEYEEPKKILKAAGIEVITASNKIGHATAKDGSTTVVDLAIDNVDIEPYAGIFFIGGPGALENLDDNKSYSLIKKAHQAHKIIGAICISTRILAKAGILHSKRATGWDGDNELTKVYSAHQVVYTRNPVVVDGTIITATGPEAAQEFGRKIIVLLKK
jgi:protease I